MQRVTGFDVSQVRKLFCIFRVFCVFVLFGANKVHIYILKTKFAKLSGFLRPKGLHFELLAPLGRPFWRYLTPGSPLGERFGSLERLRWSLGSLGRHFWASRDVSEPFWDVF